MLFSKSYSVIASERKMKYRRDFDLTRGFKGQTNLWKLTALRTLAKTCNFGVLEISLIRDRIVIGVRDNQACKKLLQVSKLTLKECRSVDHETSSQQLRGINQVVVSAISQSNEKTPPPEERKKSATGSVLKCMSGTSFNVFHGVRLALTVDFNTTLQWPAKPNCLHPVWPHPLHVPHQDIPASQCMQWKILTLMNMLLVLM